MKIARVAVPLLLAAFACDRPTPPEPGDYTPGGPFNTDSPRQLTFSPGPDLSPAWLPDGSGIIYQFVRLDQIDGDRCLGVLPAEGGTLRAEICNNTVAGADSTDAYGDPAVSAAGRLFFSRASAAWRLHNLAPALEDVAVTPVAAAATAPRPRALPHPGSAPPPPAPAPVRRPGGRA